MAIDTLPDPPSRSEPAEFSDKADDFLSALPLFGEQCNDVAEAMNLNDTSSVSTTAILIETGSKALTVEASKSYLEGMYVQIARTSAPANWMNGVVTSYTYATGALVVEVGHYAGSGTFSDWTVTFSAAVLDDVAYASTMSGDESLTYTSGMQRKYIYDPNGGDRVLTPSGTFPDGYEAVIKNTGDTYSLTFESFVIPPGKTMEFLYDGAWTRFNTHLDFDMVNISIAGSVVDGTDLSGAVDLQVVGDYAYVCSYTGASLAVVDVSDPTDPIVIGSTGTLTNLAGARAVCVSGNHAYVAAFDADRLTIINISDPTTPVEVGSVTGSNLDGAEGVCVSGNYAYVTAYEVDKLTVVDITDPTNPTELGSVAGTYTNRIRKLNIVGNYAYATAYADDSLTIFNISDPTTPVQVGTTGVLPNMGGAYDVYVSGAYAYVSASDGYDLTIFNISDPTALVQVGTTSAVSGFGSARGLSLSGDYLYLIGAGVMGVFDISDPTTPVEVGRITNAEIASADNIFILGGYAYIPTAQNSLVVIDLDGQKLTTLEAGTIKSNNIDVLETLRANDIHVKDGIKSGAQGISSEGPISGPSISSPLLSGDPDTGLLSVSTEVYANDLTGTTRRLALIKDDGELGYDSSGSIDTAELVDLAVTVEKIADNAVNQDKIGSGIMFDYDGDNEYSENSSTPAEKISMRFFCDGNANALNWVADLKNTSPGIPKSDIDIRIDGILKDSEAETNTVYTENTGNFSISSISEGWHELTVDLSYDSLGGAGPAYMRRFAYYIS